MDLKGCMEMVLDLLRIDKHPLMDLEPMEEGDLMDDDEVIKTAMETVMQLKLGQKPISDNNNFSNNSNRLKTKMDLHIEGRR